MRKKQLMRTTMFISLLVSSYSFATNRNVNVINGEITQSSQGNGVSIHYEKMLNNSISMGIRGIGINYTYDDSSYSEDGSVVGIDYSFRWYLSSGGSKGFYIGSNLGLYKIDWTYPSRDIVRKRSSLNMNIAFVTGWKIPVGNFFIGPSLAFGFLPDISDDTSLAQSAFTDYALLGIEIGSIF